MVTVGTDIFSASQLSTVKNTKQSYEQLLDSAQKQCGNIENFDVVTSKTVKLRVTDGDKIGFENEKLYYLKNQGEKRSNINPGEDCTVTWNTVNSGEDWVGGSNPDTVNWGATLLQEGDSLKIEVERR